MRLPYFPARKKTAAPPPNERIFAEASELAQRRLQQCITDLHHQALNMQGTLGPGPAAEELHKPAV